MRAEEKGKGSKQRKAGKGDGRIYRFVVTAAAVLVMVLALLLHGGGESQRYERYRRQAAESYQRGEYDQALSSLHKAEAINSSEEVLMLMAECYEAQGNLDMALETMRKMDRGSEAVTERIASLEQRKLQQQGEGKLVIAGEGYDPATTELELSDRGLGNGVIRELLQLYALNKLSLADNAISDIGPLAALGGMRSLDLSGNRIADISALAQLANLRTLNLDGNPVADLSPLYGLQELGSLSLLGVKLPEGEPAALSSALPACAILTDGEEDGVQSIWLSGVCFDTNVEELDLSGLGIRDLSCLSRCGELKKLVLTDNAVSDLSPLMNLQKLERLMLAGNQISDLRPLLAMTGLRQLDVSRNSVSETSALANLTRLQSLDLSDNPLVDFSGLKSLYALETLRLENAGVTDEALANFYEMKRLTTLALERNQGLTETAVKALKKQIPDCSVSHGTLVIIICLGGVDFRTDVTSLCIERTELSSLFGLEKFDCLETVQLGRNQIEDLSAFQNTHSRDTIRSLDLSFNRIRDVSPLAALSSLESLDLRSNQISSLGLLARMTQLKRLDLSGNPLEPKLVEELRRALPDCEIIF